MLVTLYKVSELYFPLLDTNVFQEKAKIDRFAAAACKRHQNSNVISSRHLAYHVKKFHQKHVACGA